MAPPWALAVAMAFLLAPAAFAQHEHHGHGNGHSHGEAGEGEDTRPYLVVPDVLHDEVQVGDPAWFQVGVVDGDGVPRPGQALHVRVLLLGRTLLEAPLLANPSGVAHFAVVFPQAGPYRVELVSPEGQALAGYDGWAIRNEKAAVTAHIGGPASVAAGEATAFRFWPQDASGRQVEHFYTLLEVVRDAPGGEQGGAPLYRAKLHGHHEGELGPSEARIAFPQPGNYTVHATIYQAGTYGPQHVRFVPAHARHAVQVTPAMGGVGLQAEGAEGPAPAEPQPMRQSGGDGSLRLVGFQADAIAAGTVQALSIAALEGSSLGPHHDFDLRLDGPWGLAFESSYLHESDGLLAFEACPTVPGRYGWSVQADAPNGTVLAGGFAVLPAGEQAGEDSAAAAFDVAGLAAHGLRSGVPARLALPAVEAGVALRIVDGQRVPVLAANLAGDGLGGDGSDGGGSSDSSDSSGSSGSSVAFTFAAPAPGEYQAQAVALGPGGGAWLSAAPLQVEPGEAWPPAQDRPRPAAADGPGRGPWPWVAAGGTLALGLLGAVLVARRLGRQRP